MDFNALDAEDYALGQAMVGYMPSSTPSWQVESYPDSIPAGTTPTNSNGWSAAAFVDALKSVSGGITDVAKTVYGIEAAAGQASLQRLQFATATDVARTQAATARDVALAQGATEVAKAQAVLAQAQQTARLQSQLATGGGMNDLVLLGLLGFGIWWMVKAAA